jgi:hypothetical protein
MKIVKPISFHVGTLPSVDETIPKNLYEVF